MAQCPKCNAHLKVTDWRQHCPHCGANIVVYDLQERLMKDADIAEVQNYYFRKKIDRLKASFVGSKLAVLRLVTSLLPIGAVFLPLVKGRIETGDFSYSGNVSAITLYNSLGEHSGELSQALSSPQVSAYFTYAAVAAALLVISLVLTLLHFILLTLACSPKAKPRNITQCVLILLTSFGAAAAVLLIPENSAVSLVPGIGGILYLLLQVINAAVDFTVLKKGIIINHAQCYVGGIPIEEYFKMVEDGVPTEEIRAKQYEILLKMQEEKEAEIAAKDAGKHHNNAAGDSAQGEDGENNVR